jgi:hypothetical protein
MSDEKGEPFVPLVDPDGRVTGVMDRATADYLASTDPNPTQVSLDAVFSRATRVKLFASRVDESRHFQFDVLRLDVTDPPSLTELHAALRIVEDPNSFGHLMMIEDHRLELWSGAEHVTTLALLDWMAIRWDSVWKHDGSLADRLRFARWLAAHGVPDARLRREEDERRNAERRQRIERWVEAMPLCLRPLWPDSLGGVRADIAPARALLATAVPDPVDRVRVLYGWFGAGAGPWSGFPAYEEVAERLLLAHPVTELVRAADLATTEAEVLGAARLFGGWDFGQQREVDRRAVPAPLRIRMREAVERQGIADNLARFRNAFGGRK